MGWLDAALSLGRGMFKTPEASAPAVGAIWNRLKTQLRRDEGEVLHAYQDSEGYWTIGIGRLIDQRKGGGISHAEAELLLDNDLRQKVAQLSTRLPWMTGLDEARQGVLVNLCFNVGMAGLLGFKKMLAAMEARNWPEASRELLDSSYHEQVGARARRLAEQIMTGVWQ